MRYNKHNEGYGNGGPVLNPTLKNFPPHFQFSPGKDLALLATPPSGSGATPKELSMGILAGMALGILLSSTIFGVLLIDLKRTHNEVMASCYQSCQDARSRALEFGKERTALYAEIGRLKRR